MPTIRNLLAQRSDLSTFIVHLTRDTGEGARANLESILISDAIKASTPFGPAVAPLRDHALTDDLKSQQAVCFTETPLEHLQLLLEEISDLPRACRFEPYGIAFTKKVARSNGCNPIWYTDITPGHEWLMNSVNILIVSAIDDLVSRRAQGQAARFLEHAVAKLAPFIEQMGTGDSYRKEFWWEREWRHRGDFSLPQRFMVIAPEAEHRELRDVAKSDWRHDPVFIDARWGLEEIIGRLAGFRPGDLGAF